MSHLFTVSQVADQLGEPPQRVAYIIRKHRLKAVERIGIIRLFDEIPTGTPVRIHENLL